MGAFILCNLPYCNLGVAVIVYRHRGTLDSASPFGNSKIKYMVSTSLTSCGVLRVRVRFADSCGR